jgi:hypothetical protein
MMQPDKLTSNYSIMKVIPTITHFLNLEGNKKALKSKSLRMSPAAVQI